MMNRWQNRVDRAETYCRQCPFVYKQWITVSFRREVIQMWPKKHPLVRVICALRCMGCADHLRDIGLLGPFTRHNKIQIRSRSHPDRVKYVRVNGTREADPTSRWDQSGSLLQPSTCVGFCRVNATRTQCAQIVPRLNPDYISVNEINWAHYMYPYMYLLQFKLQRNDRYSW
jgi:hypothetical protein